VWEEDCPVPREILLQKAKEADGMLTMLTERIDEEFFEQATRLRIVANMAVGYDNINVPAARDKGVVITNTPDVLTDATADLAFLLMMATGRRIIEANHFLHEGRWQTWSPYLLAGQKFYGATLGIIGMGRIGEAVVKRAKGFHLNVLYHNRNRKPHTEEEYGVTYRDLDDLLRESDYVLLLTPLTNETRLLMGAREFSLMKPTSVFVNVSRGGTVDETALYDALVENKIWAAGLDVFQQEPVPVDHPLLRLPNVVALPHIGSATYETRDAMANLAAQNLIAFFSGKGPLTPV